MGLLYRAKGLVSPFSPKEINFETYIPTKYDSFLLRTSHGVNRVPLPAMLVLMIDMEKMYLYIVTFANHNIICKRENSSSASRG